MTDSHSCGSYKWLRTSNVRLLFLLVAALSLFLRFLLKVPLPAYYTDDFFYYLKIAQNIASHGMSSFDGIHLTNGYHPLWTLTLALLSALCPGQSFYFVLQGLTLAAAYAFFEGAVRVFRTIGISEPTRGVLVLVVSLQCLIMSRAGMEVTLTLPLAVWLIALMLQSDDRPLPAIGLGLLASLTVLSRLDAIFLIALLVCARLDEVKNRLRWAVAFFAGMTPLFAYFAFNQLYFHSMMPISGRAKQLKVGMLPSLAGPLSVVFPLDRTKLIFTLPGLLLLLFALLHAARFRRSLPAKQGATLFAVLLFPLVHLLALSIVSDWPLWGWYTYPLVLSSVASLALLAAYPSVSRDSQMRRLTPVALILGCALLAYSVGYSIRAPKSLPSFTASAQIAQFMNANPGIYAMGDRAGAVGYLSSQPLIQLEGLTMDRNYLQKIQARRPLHAILKDYGVNYYITLSEDTPAPGKCDVFREPYQAGSSSPVALGQICSPPIETVYDPVDSVSIEIFPADVVQ